MIESNFIYSGSGGWKRDTRVLSQVLKVTGEGFFFFFSPSFWTVSSGGSPGPGAWSWKRRAREQHKKADMDPMKAQQLAAELEVEMMADMYNR